MHLHPGRLARDLRICRLHGIVIDRSNDLPEAYRSWGKGERVVGLLLSYVESCKGYGRNTLQSMSGTFIQEHCSRIIRELEHLIQALHGSNLVWGDAKPGNILVDKDGSIWLIDFGGSFTIGWVDQHNHDSKAGDLQGLERIKRWLQTQE
jgi:serine/threonine protein kinase